MRASSSRRARRARCSRTPRSSRPTWGAASMHELLLDIEAVTAGYEQDIDVLRDISLQVHAGQVSGLIGLNGAGKSTVVKTICGFLAPKSGRIEMDGHSIAGIAPHRLIDHGICCIPQESSLFVHLTVEENLLLPLQGRARRFG